MRKILSATLLCATLLSGCAGQSAPVQFVKDNVQAVSVSAVCTDFDAVQQYGTLTDENGEVWYFEDVQLSKDSEYTITYWGKYELVSLEQNGRVLLDNIF